MAIIHKRIAATSGSREPVFTVNGDRKSEYDFILSLASNYGQTCDVYWCDLEDKDLLEVQSKIAGETDNVAVIVNTEVSKLKERLSKYDFTSSNKFNPKFYAATSN
jgi:hypothetical protein